MAISLFSQGGSGMSAWKQLESWRAKQQQYTAEFESQANQLMSALTTAFTAINECRIVLTVNKAVAAAQQRVAAQAALSDNPFSGIDFSI